MVIRFDEALDFDIQIRFCFCDERFYGCHVCNVKETKDKMYLYVRRRKFTHSGRFVDKRFSGKVHRSAMFMWKMAL